jgi:hypothetical protein
MAYYDHEKAAFENKCKEEYEKLKENLRKSKNEDDEMLLRHIMKLEYESEGRRLKNVEYENFFKILQKLLPKQSSIHDVIG